MQANTRQQELVTPAKQIAQEIFSDDSDWLIFLSKTWINLSNYNDLQNPSQRGGQTSNSVKCKAGL